MFALLLFFILLNLKEDDKKNYYLEPIIISLMILTKHTLGLLVIPSLIYSKKRLKTFLVYVISFLILLLYLIINNNIFEFIDYCILGMFSFTSNNGTTSIKNQNKEDAIIDEQGNFIVKYGQYRSIYHIGCFYNITDNSDTYRKMLLKSDGSILYQDDNDRFLKDITIKEIGKLSYGKLAGSMGYTMIEMKNDKTYVLYSANGKELITLDIIKEQYPTFNHQNILIRKDNKYVETNNTKYLSLYYNDKTYIFNLIDEKLTMTLEGNYVFDEINKGNDNQYILKCKGTKCKNSMIIVNNDKISYQTECENIRFVDNLGKLCCHDAKMPAHNFYTIDGDFIETVKLEKNAHIYETIK